MKHIIQAHLKLIIAILVALAFLSVPYWVFSRIQEKTAESNTALARFQDEQDRLSKLQATQVLFEETKTYRDRLDAVLVPADGVVGLVNSIESFGAIAHATTTILALVDEAVKDDKTSTEVLTVGIRAGGTWKEVTHFLALLETLPYAFSFDQAVLKALPESDGDKKTSAPTKWEVTLSLKVAKYQK